MSFDDEAKETNSNKIKPSPEEDFAELSSNDGSKGPRSRAWIFTLNNYTAEDIQAVRNVPSLYTVCGEEVGESGTPHLQGYFYFSSLKTWKAVCSYIPRAWVKAAKASPQANIRYCSKQGKSFTTGRVPDFNEVKESRQKGGFVEQSRWEAARALAKAGKIDELPADIYWRFYRTAKDISRDNKVSQGDAEDVTGVWIYGPAGCGKSRYARDQYQPFYPKPCNKWWDGYEGEDYVILDDVDPDNAKYLAYHLKIWMDRYEFVAEVKGATTGGRIRPKKFIVTSQYSIEEVFTDPKTVDALRRRCTVVNMA